MPVTSGISQYQQPTGYSMSMNDDTSSSSPKGCMKPVSATCLPSSSCRYCANVGWNFLSSVVSVKTPHGKGLTPVALTGGSEDVSNLASSGREERGLTPPT